MSMATMTQVCLSILVSHVFLTFFPDVIEGLNPTPPRTRSPPQSPTLNSSDIEAAQPIPEPEIHHGLPKPRDPDALPPRNVFESFFESLHTLIAFIGTGNVIFAIKAGLLTVVLCLPSLIKSSAKFAYGVCGLLVSTLSF
jgi:hypothetical protein